ncbi:polysaccharide deacetylase family protein [Ostreiculturibacter nitratireducens]|uniref:polysaccharide deacetylase family protein n=1 Tax=Ostreiculturibacter nitratireducens TaxID=3075226 RepID=UPI0031B57314
MLLNPLPWPNGARLAAAITFDVDADSLARSARMPDGHPRLQAVSMGRYGPTVAVPRILATLRRFGLKQTFFMPGWVMRTYPATVEAILKDGHEIGHHSWCNEDPAQHSAEREAELFGRAMDIHVRLTGRRPRGYRAPMHGATQAVLDHLVREGFVYDSSLMADEMPYMMRTPKGQILEIPPCWACDRLPLATFGEAVQGLPVAAPSDGLRVLAEEYEAARAVGGFWMPVLRPCLTGRLAPWSALEAWLETVLKRGEAWFAPLEDIAAFALSHRARLRVETLPYPEI